MPARRNCKPFCRSGSGWEGSGWAMARCVDPANGERYTKCHGQGRRSVQGGNGWRTADQGTQGSQAGPCPGAPRTRTETGSKCSHRPARDIDRALSRGKRSPEAKLDLHGMTLGAAERAVAEFLAQSSEHGRRIVLIVTGQG